MEESQKDLRNNFYNAFWTLLEILQLNAMHLGKIEQWVGIFDIKNLGLMDVNNGVNAVLNYKIM